MADHAAAEPDVAPTKTSEPVLIAHSVSVILAALVGLGWLTLSDPMINTIGTGLFLILSTVSAVIARGKVKPVDGSSRALTADDVVAYANSVVADQLAAFEARQAAESQPRLQG